MCDTATSPAMLDVIDDAAFALDARGRVLSKNAAAESLLARGLVRERLGTLEGWRELAPGHAVPFGVDASLTGLAFPAPPRLARSGTARLVFVSRRRRPPARTLLAERFGLTPAEADLMYSLGAGEDLDTIGARRRVEKSTLRSQLRSLLRKLGVRRQAEVVSFALRMFPSVREPDEPGDAE